MFVVQCRGNIGIFFLFFFFIYEMHENYSYIGSTIIVLMHREVSFIENYQSNSYEKNFKEK